MPELPDLQVFSKNLNKALKGKTLKRVNILNDKKIKESPSKFKSALEGEKLTDIRRVGKELHFQFSNGNILGLHLMLNGKLFLFDDHHEQKYPIIELFFEGNKGLVMTDFQGLATPTLNPEERDAPDALSKELTETRLKEMLSKSKAVIKKLLLDQNVIRGIGNAYADEILWDAKISPMSVCNKIPEKKVKDLLKSIRDVLHDAEKSILKEHPDIISGEIRDFMNVHNAKKKTSPTGGIIKQEMINSRKTYYTDEQELFI